MQPRCAALPMLRRRQGTPTGTFIAPAGVIVSILATLLCIALLTNSTLRELRHVAIAAGVGGLINVVMLVRARRVARCADARVWRSAQDDDKC